MLVSASPHFCFAAGLVCAPAPCFRFQAPSLLPGPAFCHSGSVLFVCRHFGFVFAVPALRPPTAAVSKIPKHVGGVIRCRLTRIFNVSQIMPCAHPLPIQDQKLATGFPADEERSARYFSWRKVVKRQMERREIHSTSNPGKQQWVALTRWSLTWVLLSDQATLYRGTSTEQVKFTATVDDLLADVLKKHNHKRQGEVNLHSPPVPTAP